MEEVKNVKTIEITKETFADDCDRIELEFPNGVEVGIKIFNSKGEEEIAEESSFDYDEQIEYIVEKTGLNREQIEIVLDAELDFLVDRGIAFIPEDIEYEE